MMKKLFVLLTIMMLVATGHALADTPKAGGTLVFGRGGDSVGLDPAYETDGNSFMICDNIFEALVFYADESTSLEPGLAKSWDISPDGKTYTFHLRKGVKFHDGTPFNADAVVFSIGRMMKERNVKFLDKNMKIPPQERPPEYWVSMEMDDTIGAIEAVDEYTVVFKLKRVEAPFLANMGMDFADIISHTPESGEPCFDNRDGVEYCSQNGDCENYADDGLDTPAICQDYTTEIDGGHLGSVASGKIRAAKAFWVMMAVLNGWDGLEQIEP